MKIEKKNPVNALLIYYKNLKLFLSFKDYYALTFSKTHITVLPPNEK